MSTGICGLCRHSADGHGPRGCTAPGCRCKVTFGEHRVTAADILARLARLGGAAPPRKRRKRAHPLRRLPRPGAWAYRGVILQWDTNASAWYSFGVNELDRPIDPDQGARSREDLIRAIDDGFAGAAANGAPLPEPPDYRDDPAYYGFPDGEYDPQAGIARGRTLGAAGGNLG